VIEAEIADLERVIRKRPSEVTLTEDLTSHSDEEYTSGAERCPQPRRADDQDPCRRQRFQPSDCLRPHPGQMGDVRSAPGLIEKLPKAAQVLADTAYDSDEFREFLIARGSTPVIKPNSTRRKIPPFDKVSYKGRNVIERAFAHLKDWRRVATRYDKLARNFRATVTLALLFRWWI
jgi:putative transposase